MGSFVLLGLPDGTLGVAWPSMRTSFGLPLAALGGLLAPVTVAYLVAGATSGHLIARIGMQRVLIGSLALFVIGLSLIAASPVWWFLPLGTSVVGLGAGALDAAVNALAATHGAQRLLGLLHGAYSAGGALGPLLVVSAVTLGLTWRGAYGVLAGLAVILTLATWLAGSWQLPASSRPAALARPAVSGPRPCDAHSTTCPASVRHRPTAAPISPGCSSPITLALGMSMAESVTLPGSSYAADSGVRARCGGRRCRTSGPLLTGTGNFARHYVR